MAQTGYTPISIYYSATGGNAPTAGNLVAGELAINTADGKLFYKDSAGAVQVLATKGGVGSSSNGQVLYNSSGLVAGSANMSFNGTQLSVANTIQAVGTDYSTNGPYISISKTAGLNTAGSIQVGDNASFRALSLNASGGNVGVGTTSPSVKFQISAPDEAFRLQSTTASSALYQTLYNSAGTRRMYQGYAGASTSDYTFMNEESGAILFGTSSAERMRLTSAGNLGVGNTAPSFRLHVTDATVAFGATLTNGTFNFREFGSSTANNTLELNIRPNSGKSGYLVFTEDSVSDRFAVGISAGVGALIFKTGIPTSGSEVMRLTSGGQLGIGTSPSSTLSVNGSSYLLPTLSTAGFNIEATGTFNDNSAHSMGSYNNCSGFIYIVGAGGTTAFPFWSNGGGGVAWQWTFLPPTSTTWVYGSGVASFTTAGTGGNSYQVNFSSGGGTITVTRTAGSSSFVYYVQLFAK